MPKINFSVKEDAPKRKECMGKWKNFEFPYTTLDYNTFEDEYRCKFFMTDETSYIPDNKPTVNFEFVREDELTYKIPSGDDHVFKITPKEHMDKILNDFNETAESPWDIYSKDLWTGEELYEKIQVPKLTFRDPYKEAEDLGEITSIQTLNVFELVFGKSENRPTIRLKYNKN